MLLRIEGTGPLGNVNIAAPNQNVKKFILVVDDNQTFSLLSPLLNNDCISVLRASTGVDAFKWIEAISVHLCFFNLSLPDMSGLDLMTAIKGKVPKAGIIMMATGSPMIP